MSDGKQLGAGDLADHATEGALPPQEPVGRKRAVYEWP